MVSTTAGVNAFVRTRGQSYNYDPNATTPKTKPTTSPNLGAATHQENVNGSPHRLLDSDPLPHETSRLDLDRFISRVGLDYLMCMDVGSLIWLAKERPEDAGPLISFLLSYIANLMEWNHGLEQHFTSTVQ